MSRHTFANCPSVQRDDKGFPDGHPLTTHALHAKCPRAPLIANRWRSGVGAVPTDRLLLPMTATECKERQDALTRAPWHPGFYKWME